MIDVLVNIGRWLKTTDELRTDNYQRIYDGQDRWFGSKEANDQERNRLLAAGDNLEAERWITHSASSCGNLSSMKAMDLSLHLAKHGYESVPCTDFGDAVRFRQLAAPKSMVFDRETSGLNDFLHECGWRYRGWECATTTQKGMNNES